MRKNEFAFYCFAERRRLPQQTGWESQGKGGWRTSGQRWQVDLVSILGWLSGLVLRENQLSFVLQFCFYRRDRGGSGAPAQREDVSEGGYFVAHSWSPYLPRSWLNVNIYNQCLGQQQRSKRQSPPLPPAAATSDATSTSSRQVKWRWTSPKTFFNNSSPHPSRKSRERVVTYLGLNELLKESEEEGRQAQGAEEESELRDRIGPLL